MFAFAARTRRCLGKPNIYFATQKNHSKPQKSNSLILIIITLPYLLFIIILLNKSTTLYRHPDSYEIYYTYQSA